MVLLGLRLRVPTLGRILHILQRKCQSPASPDDTEARSRLCKSPGVLLDLAQVRGEQNQLDIQYH